MAKGQKRSGREPKKKPKQDKVKGSPPATAISITQPKPTASVSDPNK